MAKTLRLTKTVADCGFYLLIQKTNTLYIIITPTSTNPAQKLISRKRKKERGKTEMDGVNSFIA